MTFSFIFSLIGVLFIRLFTLHMFALLIRLFMLSSGCLWSPLISKVDRDDLLGVRLFALSSSALRYPLEFASLLHITSLLHIASPLGGLLSGSLGRSLGSGG